MLNKQTKPPRILAISLSSPGFGYALIEGEKFADFGNRRLKKDKNVRCLGHIKKFIVRCLPDVLVLSDVNAKGARRDIRIKNLHKKILSFANGKQIKIVTISSIDLRERLLGNEAGTKQEMAELLAKQFPDELKSRLPEKRKPWKSEDARMDIFDAVGLVAATSKRPHNIQLK